ncbi:MAG: ECF-type sigma factor [Planctomycetota bacterium]|jgi:RNA polymerase sigma factor (TIGR02999 family)
MTTEDDVTGILNDLGGSGGGDDAAMVRPVYEELRRLAGAYLREERPDHTLQATALVHEAYMRLARSPDARWNDRIHFFRVAAKTMRRILVNHAVARRRLKRGGGGRRLALEEVTAAIPGPEVDLVDLDEALGRLGDMDERLATLVELRFFAGCTNEQVAEILDVSTRTVEREWRTARAWLHGQMDAS